MRVLAVATILLLSTSLVPAFAQKEGLPPVQSQPQTAPAPTQPQTVPVEPERTPQQSEQSRGQEQRRGEDVQVGRDWRTQPRDGDRMGRMGQNDMGRMMEQMDREMRRDHDYMEREEGYHGADRAERDRYGRRYYGEHRVKICVEYEDGDEYCRYRYRD